MTYNQLKKTPNRYLEKVGGTKFWLQKPRYREVRVIERRVIERSDCICFLNCKNETKVYRILIFIAIFAFFSPHYTVYLFIVANRSFYGLVIGLIFIIGFWAEFVRVLSRT